MKKISLLGMAIIIVFVIVSLCSCSKQHKGGIDTFTTPNGKKLVISFIKHASLQIVYDGKEYEIDPVASAVRPIVDYTDKPQADYILVTHDHYDHFDMNAVFLLTKKYTNLFLTSRCFYRYKRGVIIHNNEKAQLGDNVWLYSVPAYNITKGKRKYHPKGVGNGYILDFDGFRVYIAGDTEVIPEMRQIKDIDIAFLPCNQPFTMTPAQLRKAAEIIKPRVLYPYHTGKTKISSIIKATSGLSSDVRIRYME